MQNFIRFLIRYHAFLLFLFLEIVCFSIVVQNNRYQGTALMNVTGSLTGSTFERFQKWREYLDLKEQNNILMGENARLRAQADNAFAWDSVYAYCVEDTLYQQLYDFIPAKVVNNTVFYHNNYMTINRGSAHGIAPQMGIIGPNGIIGLVQSVSENYAVVMSLLHSEFTSSAALEKNGIIGRLSWNGRDYRQAQLRDIANHVELLEGDKIITTGYGSIFPEGLAVGTIAEIKPMKASTFLEVDVLLAEDFSSLRYVYVVVQQEILKEQIELEAQGE